MNNNQLVKQLKSDQPGPREYDMLSSGGKWLGEARQWIQWNCANGSYVTWGSEDLLKINHLTVGDIERFAASIAAATLREFESHLVTEGQAAAIKTYEKKENWRKLDNNESLGSVVFDPDRDRLHWKMSFKHRDGWDLSECID